MMPWSFRKLVTTTVRTAATHPGKRPNVTLVACDG